MALCMLFKPLSILFKQKKNPTQGKSMEKIMKIL